MVKKGTFFVIIGLILTGFGIGIYLQDLKHRESTAAAWKANRHNLERFDKIKDYTSRLNSTNWPAMRDSIFIEMDTVIRLRFRKEWDSLQSVSVKD